MPLKLASVLSVATLLSVGFAGGATAAQQKYTYGWQYTAGQVLRYHYTSHQAGVQGATTAVARLATMFRNGVGGSRVRWTALTVDGQNLDSVARAYPPYEVSLDPADPKLNIPKATIPATLQNPVDGLLTILVGLNPIIGIDQLHQAGTSYTYPHPLIGNFRNSTTPVGRDATRLTSTLKALTASNATFQSTFWRPRQSDLKLSRSWMASPVCGTTPNNFELVQSADGGYVALWGCEFFAVTTTVDRTTGHIISAVQHDSLHVDGRFCPTIALTSCTAIPASSEETIYKLNALPTPAASTRAG
jgi:hypothetical protein